MNYEGYKTKVKQHCDDIMLNLSNGSVKGGLSRSGNTMHKIVFGVLLKSGIIKNVGSKTRPEYEWGYDGKVQGEKLKSVTNLVIEKNRSVNNKHTKAEVEDCTIEVPVETKKSGLSEFSDSALWKELKARGYIIENNRLMKKFIIYLD